MWTTAYQHRDVSETDAAVKEESTGQRRVWLDGECGWVHVRFQVLTMVSWFAQRGWRYHDFLIALSRNRHGFDRCTLRISTVKH